MRQYEFGLEFNVSPLCLAAPVFEVLAGDGGGADFMRSRLLGQHLTNTSLRQRLGLEARQIAQASRLIALARERGLIRAADDAERAYVPGWVGRATGGTAP